jgi:hypothetical protein
MADIALRCQRPYLVALRTATKKRFEHVHGLFDLCDATQQLYLNLPSWRTEWHEQFERRRARAMAKAQAGPSAEP